MCDETFAETHFGFQGIKQTRDGFHLCEKKPSWDQSRAKFLGGEVVKRSRYALGPVGGHGRNDDLSLPTGKPRGGLEQVVREELRFRRRHPGRRTEAEADAAAACQGRAKRRRKRTPPAEQPPHLTGGRR
jgi:hypothetical protein